MALPAAPAHAGKMDQPGLITVLSLAGEPGDRQHDVGFRTREGTARHLDGNGLADSALAGKDLPVHPQHGDFGVVAVNGEAALEHMALSLDIGQDRTDKAAGAAFSRRQGQKTGARPIQQTAGHNLHCGRQLRSQRLGISFPPFRCTR